MAKQPPLKTLEYADEKAGRSERRAPCGTDGQTGGQRSTFGLRMAAGQDGAGAVCGGLAFAGGDETVGGDAVTRSRRLKLVVQRRHFLVLAATRRPPGSLSDLASLTG